MVNKNVGAFVLETRDRRYPRRKEQLTMSDGRRKQGEG
jgi:hypothetical protein